MNYFGFHRRMILTNALFEAHPKSCRARWKRVNTLCNFKVFMRLEELFVLIFKLYRLKGSE